MLIFIDFRAAFALFECPASARFKSALQALIRASRTQSTDVKISGFGNFQVRTKQARPGRNPRTGESVLIAARRAVTFQASAKLKQAI